MKLYKNNFQDNLSDWWLKYLLWDYPRMNVTGLYRWYINIVSGYGFVPSGNKLLFELIMDYLVTLTYLSRGLNELNLEV